ncbi:MAG: hypothetical protein LBV01_04105 [Deltaproteobacteria bacterium]|jgi:hypothetical protein|nr:hypothetical protein [Deltaproteobacteria bacterium]
MKRISIFLCGLLVFSLAAAAQAADGKKARTPGSGAYTLVDSFEVKGRQGIAVDDKHYYVSGSKALYKYDKKGNLLASNENPFEGYAIPSNHIGDIDVFNGEIFVSAEWFEDGVGKDIQIAIHDADTLKFKRTFKFSPESGQEEVSGICVDRDKRTVWMSCWAIGKESGLLKGYSDRYLYEYSLDSGKFLRKVHLAPSPQWIQGVYYYKGALYVTADDGEADDDAPDHLYRVDVRDNVNYATVVMVKSFTEVKRQGEIEGLAFDEKAGQLLVHFNRGSRIILGMPKGFYPGYTKEISEVYRFDVKAKKKMGGK